VQDWEWLIDRADRSRVLPSLAAAALECLTAEDLGPVRDHLVERLRNARLRHLTYIGHLASILRAFAADGIDSMAFKGPVLAELLYDDPGLREYADLDVLIHPGAAVAARETLMRLGWKPLQPLDERALQRLLEKDCEERWALPDDEQLLELHWRLIPPGHPCELSIDGLWAHSVEATIGGCAARVFDPADVLLTICHHAHEKHRWMRLQMVLDVARFLVRYPTIDGEELRRRSAAAGLDEAVALGLHLASSWLGAPIPESLHAFTRPTTRTLATAAVVRGRLFRENRGLAGLGEWRAYARHEAKLADVDPGAGAPLHFGVGEYARQVMAPDWADRRSWRLPRLLQGLHWVWRPIRLVARHGLEVVGRVR